MKNKKGLRELSTGTIALICVGIGVLILFIAVLGDRSKEESDSKEIIFDCYNVSFEEGNYSYWTTGGILVFEKNNETLYCNVKDASSEEGE